MDNYRNNIQIDNMDIAAALLQMLPEDIREQFNGAEIIEALYDLQAAAQNKYNFNYFRQFYNLMIELTETAGGARI